MARDFWWEIPAVLGSTTSDLLKCYKYSSLDFGAPNICFITVYWHMTVHAKAMKRAMFEADFFTLPLQFQPQPHAVTMADYEDNCWRLVRRSDPKSIALLEAHLVDIVFTKEPRSKWFGLPEAYREWSKASAPEEAPRE
jgi:hypothetical protein